MRKPKKNAAPGRKRSDGTLMRDDGRRQLLIYLKPMIIRRLKLAALKGDKPAYELAEEAIDGWLEDNGFPAEAE